MPNKKTCKLAGEAPLSPKKALADQENGPLALAINIGFLALSVLILIEVARHG